MITIIADRRRTKAVFSSSDRATSRLLAWTGLLLCLAFLTPVWGQSGGEFSEFSQARSEFDNGNYPKAIEFAEIGIGKARKAKNNLMLSEGLDIFASSQISLGKYDEAAKTLYEALQNLPVSEADASYRKALIYTRLAWLLRSQRKFSEALEYSKKAIAAAPKNRRIEAEHYFNVGRVLFVSGYDISAVVWLEKAEKLLEPEKDNSLKLDVYRFLTLAWSSKLNYQAALKYTEKWISSAEKTRFKHKHRQALLESATLLSASGQEKKAFSVLEKGLKLSVEQNSPYQACLFLTSLLLQTLNDGDAARASGYLDRLEKINADNQFTFEIKLGKAILSAFQGQTETSENYFIELNKMEKTSESVLPYWRVTIAERNQNWEQLIKYNQELFELATTRNYREDLPGIYLNFAKAHYRLGQLQKSAENLEKSLSYIEEARKSENHNLTLGLLETYHNGYRLLAQIKFDNPQESFELSDFLKARLLKDRISGSAKSVTVISPVARRQLEELSIKFIDDQNFAAEIEKIERLITTSVSELNLSKPNLTEMDKIADLNEAAIISYFFTLDKKLLAYVWEKGKLLQTIQLSVSEDEVDSTAKTTQQKIKNLIFFKRDGRQLFDKLIKPLNLSAKHLIIVPDKSLWKIPFQALSADGEKYLIEEKLISYAPSVAVLLEQLQSPPPARRTLQAFANSNYENRFLQHVNAEAGSVAGIYNSKPLLDTTVADFARLSDKTDIIHFSMHAQVDKEQPLDSFLGFRAVGKDNGRLTAEELLNVKLKKGSLAFLASCDTNNVLDGEGLVSLAWAMMGSGATTVVSAQWEANDKSTEIFTKAFYRHYRQGSLSVEAMQKAALELIKNKSQNMHEPYYWADFTLNGDFR